MASGRFLDDLERVAGYSVGGGWVRRGTDGTDCEEEDRIIRFLASVNSVDLEWKCIPSMVSSLLQGRFAVGVLMKVDFRTWA